METESHNVKSSSRSSSVEDIVIVKSQEDTVSDISSKNPSDQPRRSSLSDLDPDFGPDLEEPDHQIQSLPIQHSLESQREWPASVEEDLDTRYTSESKEETFFTQNEDDYTDEASPLTVDADTKNPELLTDNDDTGHPDSLNEHSTKEAASADVLPECKSPVQEEPAALNEYSTKQTASGDVLSERKSSVQEEPAAHESESRDATSPVPSLRSAVNVSSNEKVMTTKHGIRIKVYVGDITKADAEAIVTSDNPFSSDMSMVTRALCQVPGGDEFRDKRQRRSLVQGKLQDGKVYTVHIKNTEFPFRYVLQAIISPYDTKNMRPGIWKKVLKMLYKNIYKKADKKDLSSVAVPLIGTGRGCGSAEDSVEAAVRTLCRYHPLSLEEIQFVSLDRGVNDYLAAVCESCCDISDDESSAEDEQGIDEGIGESLGPLQMSSANVTASLSDEKVVSSNRLSNILLTPPANGARPLFALSSAQSVPASAKDLQGPNLASDKTSPVLTREERLQKLMSQAGHSEDANPGSNTSDETVLNDIPESTLTFSHANDLISTKKNSHLVPKDTGEGVNEPVNIIKDFRGSDISRPVESDGDLGNSSNDDVIYETYCGSNRKKLTSKVQPTSQTCRSPLSKPENNGVPDFDDFDASQYSVYYGRGTGPGDWRYSTDNLAEYGSDDGDYDQKCADVEEDEFEIQIDSNLVQTGNQPPGTMTVTTHDTHLPGYEDVGTIVIAYIIPSGHQTEDHPHPGRRYHGVHRRAFLPDNEAGRMVMRMLKVAFERRLVFTVGRSLTTGMSDVVRWGPISHKTSQDGGPQRYGYPDDDYLNQVTNELLNLGIADTASEGADDMNSLLVSDKDRSSKDV